MKVTPNISTSTIMLLLLLVSVGINVSHWVVKQGATVVDSASDELDAYQTLAEKAFTAQADFQTEIWADMLADDIVFEFPDTTFYRQNNVAGKEAVLKYWVILRGRIGIKTIRLSGFNHAPCSTTQKMKVSGLAGVHVFSLINSQWQFQNGQTADIMLNFYCHFNEARLIDRCFVNYDRVPLTKAVSQTTTEADSKNTLSLRSKGQIGSSDVLMALY